MCKHHTSAMVPTHSPLSSDQLFFAGAICIFCWLPSCCPAAPAPLYPQHACSTVYTTQHQWPLLRAAWPSKYIRCIMRGACMHTCFFLSLAWKHLSSIVLSDYISYLYIVGYPACTARHIWIGLYQDHNKPSTTQSTAMLLTNLHRPS